MNFSMKATYLTRGNRSEATCLLAILAISMFATIVPATVGSVSNTVTASAIEKLANGLTQSLAETSASAINVIVEATANAPVIEAIEDIGGEVSTLYESVEAFAASVPADKILDLAENPNVVKIFEDSMRYMKQGPTNPVKLDYNLGPFHEDTVLLEEEVSVNPVDAAAAGSAVPSTFAVAELTHAEDIWSEADYGEGSTVAVIDTGCWVDPWIDPDTGDTYYPWYTFPDLTTNVIDGIDLSYDVGTGWEGYGAPTNHPHGSGTAGFIANHVELIFGPGHSWGESFLLYYPEGGYKDADGRVHLFVFGVAPLASIYAVKVFDHTGGGIPSSLVMAGMDHVIQLKLESIYDIDVMSMSLGGGVGAPGEDPEDLLADAATEAGILVSVAAGNEGPAPITVGSPATAKTCIATGGAADPIHERAYGNIALWNYGIPGYYYWPSNEIGLYEFTSKGPTSDGRQKPDVISTASALLFSYLPGWAMWAYGVPYTLGLGWGTSFSCPQTSGLAALLASYGKTYGLNHDPCHLKTALIEGADPLAGFIAIEQGAGYINAFDSLEIFKTLPETLPPETYPEITDWDPPVEITQLDNGAATFENIALEPAKYAYFYFRLGSEVDSIKITISGVTLSNWNPVFGDSYNVYLTTAARDGIGDYLIGDPQWFIGDSEIIVSLDTDFQPGVIRLVLTTDFSSFGTISFDEMKFEVTELAIVETSGNQVTLENRGIFIPEAQVEVYRGRIRTYFGAIEEGEWHYYAFEMPMETQGIAIITLSWE
ncbi:MAG: S8 family serine peptidase, partial [Candidatus Bathyarchaeota archaeon]|nr:S8 family serine peptidase [Candidatus Bathyarchaeota archaeon]